MADGRSTDAVTPAAHAVIVELISAKLSPGSSIMVIGGGLMMASGMRHVEATKDEDIVLLLFAGGKPNVADVEAVERLIRDLGAEPRMRKDQTSVNCQLRTPVGIFFIEFVRGRRGGHGYFISRAVLEAVAELSRRDGRVLTPPLEALAFLKAWAAVDKAKLVASGRDGRGYHASRERAFREDVIAIRRRVFESRQSDEKVFRALLAVCSADRSRAVGRVLVECGWNL